MAIESNYAGPVESVACRFGGRAVQIVRPADPDRLLEDPDVHRWNRQEDYMPYWAYLWPGAFLLAEAIASAPWAEGTPALEIGCGLGMAGLAGVAAGLHVHFTDYDDAPLDFVRRSALANDFDPARYSTGRLDWRSPETRRYPVILGADVLYEARLVPLVVNVLKAQLHPEGCAWVAGPYRVATEQFEPQLRAAGFRVEAAPIAATNERGETVRGTLHKLWKA